MPAATALADNLKPTKQNDGISAVVTSCTYGAETSVAALAKTVGLSYEVTSRPLTAADLKKGISEAQKLKINFVPYSGLGLSAFYYTFTEGGVLAQGHYRAQWQEGIRGVRLHQVRVDGEARRSRQAGGKTLNRPKRRC